VAFTPGGDVVAVGKASDHVPVQRVADLRARLTAIGLGW
jgi:hypothetical protein